MTDETDTVTGDEIVIRRILKHKDWYDPSLPMPIGVAAVSPTKKDKDGLSVFRLLFSSPEQVVATGRNPAGYHVALLKVLELAEIDLTVLAAPDPAQRPGHSIIPELSYPKDKEEKK